jgi:hypothetical protein
MYKVVKQALSKEQVTDLMSRIKQNNCIEPHDFPDFQGIKLDYDLLDSDGVIQSIVKMAHDYFLENFSVPNREMLLTRSYGTIMHPGAFLGVHKDLYNSGRIHDFSYGDALVCNIYLSENFEGGELVFPEIGVEIKPEIGDAVFFPGYLLDHGVNEIKSGVRVSLINHFSLMSEEDSKLIQDPNHTQFYTK